MIDGVAKLVKLGYFFCGVDRDAWFYKKFWSLYLNF